MWEDWHVEHIAAKHNISPREVEEACFDDGSVKVLRGKGKWEEKLYYILGTTLGGRYLFIVVKPLGKGKAKVITAINMNNTEKRKYKEVK